MRMTSAIATPILPRYAPARHWPSGAFAVWSRLLIPGYVQWSWGQHERALVIGGTYASSLATALLLWGSPATWGFAAVAVACRTVAWVDAHRQDPFSGFTPTNVLTAAGGCVAVALHAPLFILLSLTAWPSLPTGVGQAVYLINRLAYQNERPAPGQWVWLHGSVSRTHHLARVVAVGGQQVEWTGRRWRVDGNNVEVASSRKLFGYAEPWEFHVPNNHTLLDPEIEFRPGEPSAPLIVVENGQIAGRAWACWSPYWERRLL